MVSNDFKDCVYYILNAVLLREVGKIDKMNTSDEFGVYCIYCGHVRWGKHSDEVRKCPNCGMTKKSLMTNVNKREIENIKKSRIRV